jgi:hypothetical protein
MARITGRPRAAQVMVALVVCLFATGARAAVPLLTGFGGPRDYGPDCLSPNDDGSSAVIDITPAFPSGLRFFTSTHVSAYVNTNGNITFSGAVPVYTPDPFPVADQPMIAAYWADVDVRGFVEGDSAGIPSYTFTGAGAGACENPPFNGVWWYIEPGRMVITWDQVGYYYCHLDLRMDFQMILTAVATCGAEAGDFDVEFRFNRCEWTTGDASGGDGGFGGTPAQVGFDAGNMTDYVQIDGSMTAGIHRIVCDESNVGEPGIWRFQIRGGTVICPDAGEPCDTGLLGVCREGRTECVGDSRPCVGDVGPSDERCDALDNDCDGETDEGEGLCPEYEICVGGVCLAPCSEFGCRPDETCLPDGRCIDSLCIDIECPEGTRCIDGVCVGACDGIVCPEPLVCRAGRCVDPCEGFTCDECTVCVAGECVVRCEWEPCDPGWVCLDDGTCVAELCVGVTCDPGFNCVDGACVDACIGAVCPPGEHCERGECVEDVAADADADGDGDGDAAGADADADTAVPGGDDGGFADGTADGAEVFHPGGEDDPRPACICQAAGAARTSGAALLLLGLALGLPAVRRRASRRRPD